MVEPEPPAITVATLVQVHVTINLGLLGRAVASICRCGCWRQRAESAFLVENSSQTVSVSLVENSSQTVSVSLVESSSQTYTVVERAPVPPPPDLQSRIIDSTRLSLRVRSLSLAAALARRVVLQVVNDGGPCPELLEADAHLQPPHSAQRFAKAYTIVSEVRRVALPSYEEHCKFAVLAVREVAILEIASAHPDRCMWLSLTDAGFELNLRTAFGNRCSPERRNQLYLTRSAICRLGRDRMVFNRAAPKMWSRTLFEDDLDLLHVSYVACMHAANAVAAASRR